MVVKLRLELKICQKISKKKIESLKILELNTSSLKNYLKVSYGVEEEELSLLHSKEKTLEDFLLEQVGLLKITGKKRKILEEFIWNLDEKGYLRVSLIELSKRSGVPIFEIRKCYELFKGLDPKGIGGKNLKEVLILQSEKGSNLEKILEKMSVELFNMNFIKISKKMNMNIEEIKVAIEPMRYFISYPRKNFGAYRVQETREEDIFYSNKDEIKLNDSYSYRVGEDDIAIKNIRVVEKINMALEMRELTLLSVSKYIVDSQKEFFNKGEMNSLKLEDIAIALGKSISTISRAIKDKTLNFNGKKYFLNEFLTNKVGKTTSYNIKRSIEKIIKYEEKKTPLSDEEVRKKLSEDKIEISRRTVAKYRDMMGILPRDKRRKY